MPTDPARQTKGPRLFSITLTLASSISLLVGLSLALVIAVMYENSRENSLELLRDRADLTALVLEDELDDVLNSATDQTQWLVQRLASKALDPNDPEALEIELLGSLAAAPDVTKVAFLAPDGRQTTAYQTAAYQSAARDQAGVRTSPVPANAVSDAAGVAARLRRDSFWLDVSYDQQAGVSFFVHVTPWWEGARYAGAVISAIALPALASELNEVARYMKATVFILKGYDRAIAHPNLSPNSDLLSARQPTVTLAQLNDPVLEKFAQAKDLSADVLKDNENLFVRRLDQAGKVYIVVYRPLSYADKNWIIGAYYPAEVFAQQVNRLSKTLLFAGATLVVSIIVAILLGRAIARPIRALGKAALSIRDFKLDKLPPLPGTAIRELNDQSRAFNAMVGGLKLFEVYVPKRLVRRLLGQQSDQSLTSQEREVSLLFTDIVGFTSLSENQQASDIAALLNAHFTLLGEAVENQGGTIDKYIGDALMAFWNAPDPQPDHAARACRAALEIRTALLADNRNRRANGLDPLGLRLGLHCGPVVVGDIGAPGRINYTVVGDTVNTTQRLEALGKEIAQPRPQAAARHRLERPAAGDSAGETAGEAAGDTAGEAADSREVIILASAEMKAAAGDGFLWREIGIRPVTGRREALTVFRLLGPAA